MMYNLERQEEILGILEQSRSISVAKLAEMLYVSQPTIRRDLGILEQQGKVNRTHGGVVLRAATDAEIPLMFREGQNNAAKRAIARKAAEQITDGDVIFLDASSTAAYLVPHIARFDHVIVVTNSPKTSMLLGERNVKNYCTGGLLLAHSIAYVGSEAERFVSTVNADLFFFSSRGYTEGGMITDSSEREVAMKKAMRRNAEKSFYLCDESKKNQKFAFNVCAVDEVDAVIDETQA